MAAQRTSKPSCISATIRSPDGAMRLVMTAVSSLLVICGKAAARQAVRSWRWQRGRCCGMQHGTGAAWSHDACTLHGS